MPDFDDHDEPTPIPEFWRSAAWGFSALVIGCTLLLSACVLMVFNVILFHGGFQGIPVELSQAVGTVGVIGVALLGLVSLWLGIRGWSMASGGRGSVALGVAGTATSLVGLIAWLIAGGDLLMILGIFQ
jgi:hypothetical protein